MKALAGPPVPAAVAKPHGWRANVPLVAGYLALLILVAGFGGWSVMTSISGAIIAPGQIVVENSRQVIQHPDGGVVAKVLVEEGDQVKAGQVLVRLDDTTKRSELAVIESQYYELVARRGRLEAERDGRDRIVFDPIVLRAARNRPEIRDLIEGQKRLFTARRESLKREIEQMRERRDQISAQIDGLKAQYAAQKKQRDLVAADLADQRSLLAKGLAQASRVSALEREAARLEGSMASIKASIAQAAGRVIEADIGILRLGTQRREDAITRLRDLRYRELELSEKRILLLDTLSRLEIRAPVSGSVYGLQINAEGAVIRPAEPLMYIVPSDRPLVIKSRVSPLHIDEVHVGQEVTLRFPAFSARTTPELFGKVAKISADAFSDQATKTSYYLVEITPNPGEIARLGNVDLMPGMPVEGFIRTAARTPLAYLLKPVTDYFTKAFREE